MKASRTARSWAPAALRWTALLMLRDPDGHADNLILP